MDERFEVQRTVPADAATTFAVVSSPTGHVAIDATGMLQGSTGDPATAVGDTFVIHMDRESIYDWSAVDEKWQPEGTWPIIPELSLKATLGILERTVARRS